MKYEVNLNESYEFSDTVANGEIISISKNVGDTIQNGEEISIVISEGKQLTIPNLIGKSRSEAKKICNQEGITCSFVYGSYSGNRSKRLCNWSIETFWFNCIQFSGIDVNLKSWHHSKSKRS